jgi:sulfur carrier protein
MKIVFNGEERELTAAVTIAELLQQHNLDSRYVAVEVNHELAPKVRHAEWMLNDGDRVEVVTLVGGG